MNFEEYSYSFPSIIISLQGGIPISSPSTPTILTVLGPDGFATGKNIARNSGIALTCFAKRIVQEGENLGQTKHLFKDQRLSILYIFFLSPQAQDADPLYCPTSCLQLGQWWLWILVPSVKNGITQQPQMHLELGEMYFP